MVGMYYRDKCENTTNNNNNNHNGYKKGIGKLKLNLESIKLS